MNERHSLKAAVPLPSLLRKIARLGKRLWVRIGLIAGLALLSVALSGIVSPVLPDEVPDVLGAGALHDILEIIASSMLAVTIFSLSVMVSVHRAVSGQWSPRARMLLLTDRTTMTTLATFLGAWLFALTGVILMDTPYIGEREVFALFLITLAVITYVVFSIMRWIVHLEDLGSLEQTADRVEEAVRSALSQRLGAPCLGGHALTPEVTIPWDAAVVEATRSGWVRHIYEDALNEVGRRHAVDIYLTVPIGRFVYRGDEIARVTDHAPEAEAEIVQQVEIGNSRSFEQDPRFGFVVLGEVASKALSPGINDSGTAIDAATRAGRLLLAWRSEAVDDAPRYERIWAMPLRAVDLLEDAYRAPGRDGAGQVEVVVTILKALGRLTLHEDRSMARAARDMARQVASRAERTLEDPSDLGDVADALSKALARREAAHLSALE